MRITTGKVLTLVLQLLLFTWLFAGFFQQPFNWSDDAWFLAFTFAGIVILAFHFGKFIQSELSKKIEAARLLS